MIFGILVFFIAIIRQETINQGGKRKFIYPSVDRFKKYKNVLFAQRDIYF